MEDDGAREPRKGIEEESQAARWMLYPRCEPVVVVAERLSDTLS